MLITMIGVIAALGLFFLLIMLIDCNRFVIKEYEITSAKLKKNETLVMISDLHSKSFGKQNEKLKAAVEKIAPDKILMAGDIYTAAKSENGKVAEDLVCSLAKKYPVYYGNGNHEHAMRIYADVFGEVYEKYAQVIKQAGVRYLVNEKAEIPENNMSIYGAEIARPYFAKLKRTSMEETYLGELLGRPEKKRFNILIAHNPDYFENYAAWGADLVVSGHVHGGLMKLPFVGGVISPSLRLFPHYDGGRFEKDGCVMILGRGMGCHTLPIRIFNPGELVVIRCRAAIEE